MINSAQQALAFAQGEQDHACTVNIPEQINPRSIRERLDLTQEDFAKLFGCNKSTLEAWEQGRRVPTGASQTLLTVIAHAPEAVLSALKQSQ